MNNGLVFSPPPVALKNFIKGFWMHEGIGDTLNPIEINIIACSGFGIIAPFKGDFYFENNEGILQKHPKSFFVGIRTRNAKLTIAGNYGMFGIVFHPHMYHKLKITAPDDLIDCNISLADVLGLRGTQMEEQLLMANSFEHKIQITSKFIENQITQNEFEIKPFDNLINNIHSQLYLKSIEEMATLSNSSVRHFNRKFKNSMGLSPKKYTRIIRFRKIIDFLSLHGLPENFTSIAYDFGYTDQSHFIREFSEFSGATPYKYFNKSIRNTNNKVMEDITSKYHY